MTQAPDDGLIPMQTMLRLINNDRMLLERLCQEGFLPVAQKFTCEQAELARVAGTLTHELEINWAGTEVILRMRTELLATRAQVAELIAVLRRK